MRARGRARAEARALGVEIEELAEAGEPERGRVGETGDRRGPLLGGDDRAGRGRTVGEEPRRRDGGEGRGISLPRRAAGERERLLGGARGRRREARPGGERRGEDEDEAAERQEGTGPSASGFPSARIRTSSSWK